MFLVYVYPPGTDYYYYLSVIGVYLFCNRQKLNLLLDLSTSHPKIIMSSLKMYNKVPNY